MFADSDVRGAAECPARPSCGTNEDTTGPVYQPLFKSTECYNMQ